MPLAHFWQRVANMMMTMIKFILPGSRRAEILQALCRYKKSTEIAGGCIRCHITRDMNKLNTIHYWEEWQSREDLEKHINSPNYRQLLEIIELSAQKPEIKFLTIAKIEGLEVVETARIAR